MGIFVNILIVLVIGLPSISYSQVYLNTSREGIKFYYDELFDNKHIDSAVIFIDAEDTLIIEMNNSYEKMEAIYYFDTLGLCNKIALKYYCISCADKHLDDILKNKKEKWIKMDIDTYITKYQYSWLWTSDKKPTKIESGILTIRKTPSQEICLTLEISKKIFERKEWKKIIKKR